MKRSILFYYVHVFLRIIEIHPYSSSVVKLTVRNTLKRGKLSWPRLKGTRGCHTRVQKLQVPSWIHTMRDKRKLNHHYFTSGITG